MSSVSVAYGVSCALLYNRNYRLYFVNLINKIFKETRSLDVHYCGVLYGSITSSIYIFVPGFK